MSSGPAPIIELLLVLGAALGFGIWELYTLRRDRKRREPPKDDGAP